MRSTEPSGRRPRTSSAGDSRMPPPAVDGVAAGRRRRIAQAGTTGVSSTMSHAPRHRSSDSSGGPTRERRAVHQRLGRVLPLVALQVARRRDEPLERGVRALASGDHDQLAGAGDARDGLLLGPGLALGQHVDLAALVGEPRRDRLVARLRAACARAGSPTQMTSDFFRPSSNAAGSFAGTACSTTWKSTCATSSPSSRNDARYAPASANVASSTVVDDGASGPCCPACTGAPGRPGARPCRRGEISSISSVT